MRARPALEGVGEGDNLEQLWTKRVGDDLLELCCIPFFAYDLALGNVVRAEASSGYVIDGAHRKLHELLGRLEYLCEWYAPGYVAVSLNAGVAHGQFFDGLGALGDAVELERVLV
ncbi:DUF4265 domain-containing protein [Sanguibacter suaedae]|uniref:DUF4265 domain-containing protein n=1 Tax=Sanguibacter suaedae TaxID=2795737 RepID=A0A934IBG5_9MICO|nr:DUF4265 domain-containing protein [Sanguibacter suaedae]MBI9114878.1 DUF4265 domain-containing protein [Sanguibacter suaedae]